MSQATSPAQQVHPNAVRNPRLRKTLSALEGYLYLAPTLIGLAIFVYIPIVTSFRLSLNRIAPFGNQMRFVGLENYKHLLTIPQ